MTGLSVCIATQGFAPQGYNSLSRVLTAGGTVDAQDEVLGEAHVARFETGCFRLRFPHRLFLRGAGRRPRAVLAPERAGWTEGMTYVWHVSYVSLMMHVVECQIVGGAQIIGFSRAKSGSA